MRSPLSRPFAVLLLCLFAQTLSAFAQTSTHPPTRSLLAMVVQQEHAVILVDPATGAILRRVAVGVNPHEIALNPAGDKLYVTIYGDSSVGRPGSNGRTLDVVDVNTWKVAQTIDLGKELRPHKDVFGPDGLLYVTGELDRSLLVVDPQRAKVIAEIPTGAPLTHMFAISPDGARAYTANVGDGTVSVLDLQTRKLVTVIPVAKTVQRMALSVDGRSAFTSDWSQPRFAVIDLGSNTVSRFVPTEMTPFVTAPTPDGRYLLVGEVNQQGHGLIEVFDLATWQRVHSLPMPARPDSFLFGQGEVYVDSAQAGLLKVIDSKTFSVRRQFSLPVGIDGMAWITSR